MASPVALRILGIPSLIRGSGQAEVGLPGQAMALLAVLASAGDRGMAREKLLALLWPDASAAAASHRLSQLLHSTRRRLESPELITGTTELRLNRECVACDLWDFLEARRAGQLERAAELYAPFLDGFFVVAAAELERWTEMQRSALAREYQETLEALAVQAELRQDPLAAAEWWGRLAQHEPLSSRVTMHLMTALAASGERARALAHAQEYQHQVRAELDAEPSPAVLALARLLKGKPSPSDTYTPAGVAIGLLPLVALGDYPEARSLADGLTEEVMTFLAEKTGIRVASRTAMTGAQGETPDVRALGSRLGLDGVLEGSVRVAGGRFRLAVRLVDVADGCQRWTERWEGDMKEVLAGEEALAHEVADRLGRRLVPGGGSGPP